MPLTAVLEFVEVAQGEFVLRQPGSEGEPLVRIRFSEESAAWLAEGRLHVAKAMVEAGMRAAAELSGDEPELEFVGPRDESSRILH
ncbi:MAG: hypothetical protein CALGDGBN_01243 [Pseudomonadales bacterium]|nr:hypothetical protein [Pseudomonadales bacterium]